jgi:hypothetical protein
MGLKYSQIIAKISAIALLDEKSEIGSLASLSCKGLCEEARTFLKLETSAENLV